MAETSMVFTPMLAHAQVNRLQKRLTLEMLSLQKELDELPEGTLYIYNNRKWKSFYMHKDGVTRGVSRDRNLVYGLARRQFISLVIRLIRDYLQDPFNDYLVETINTFLSELDVLIGKFETAGLDIDRITMTPNQYIWNSDRESKKPTYREDLIYPTIGRVYMRTKSEQALGNLLERLRIPYRYETPLTINGITYHPDFIIMLPTGRLIIIEHAGRTDLRSYNEGLLSRLEAFNDSNLLMGRDVFLTFEADTRDEVILKEVLFQILTSSPSNNMFLRDLAVKAGCRFD